MRVEFVLHINHEAKIAVIASSVGSDRETSGRKLFADCQLLLLL